MRAAIAAIACLLTLQNATGQELKLKPKFLTFHNARISGGFGGDGGFLFIVGPKPTKTSGSTSRKKEENAFYSAGFCIPLDLHSPNSVLAFQIEPGMTFQYYQRHEDTTITKYNSQTQKPETKDEVLLDDVHNIISVEVPAYLKFRFGKVSTSRGHFCMLLGGLIGFPITGSVPYRTGETRDHFMSMYYAVSGAVGTEIYMGKRKKGNYVRSIGGTRVGLYIKGNYALTDKLRPHRSEDNFISREMKEDYSKFQFRDLSVTFAVRFFFSKKRQ